MLDILADRLAAAVAEQPLGRRAEGLDDAPLVDDDHGVGNGVENDFMMGFTRNASCALDAPR